MLKKVFSKACLVGAMTASALFAGQAAAESEPLWQDVQDRGSLRCGAAVAPPYVIRDPKTGEYSGIYVDLCREFAEQHLGVKAEFMDTTWDNIIAGLQAGKWDISLALNRKPKRAMAISFSISPMYGEVSFVYNNQNSKVPSGTSNLADFDKKGITLAVMSGTVQDQAVSDVIKNAKILRLPAVDETRLALLSRRADVLVDMADTNRIFAASNKEWAQTVYPQPALLKQGIANGLRKGVSWSDVEAFNIYLEEKIAKGDVERLVEMYTEQAIANASK
ncbi:transporter substrate-binding domain-containing protein [Maribrevibacterium harenarium]|uniref:Transporter substrate-binding domain-containing protein n=2 Tax=Maribrevibacterium harenarium TaxID=2589817 RepID=A0A501WUI0_9GAMM|nr:transporter substrate-binding domain-containing protein [Maribrevibacterium harenarium]